MEGLRRRKGAPAKPNSHARGTANGQPQDHQSRPGLLDQSSQSRPEPRASLLASVRLILDVARPYFVEPETRLKAWLGVLAMLALIAAESQVIVATTFAKRDFNTALQRRDAGAFWAGLCLPSSFASRMAGLATPRTPHSQGAGHTRPPAFAEGALRRPGCPL